MYQYRYVLSFFVGCAIILPSHGQHFDYVPDSALIIEVPSDHVRILSVDNQPLSIAMDGSFALSVMSVNHGKKEIHILKIDLRDYSTSMHIVRLKKKPDRRNTRAQILFSEDDSNVFYLSLYDIVYIVDGRNWKVKDEIYTKQSSSDLFMSKDYFIRANYYNELDRKERTFIRRYESNLLAKEVSFHGHEVTLTHLSPNRLFAFTSDYIFRLSVSEPWLYRYDHQLNLIDSLQYESNGWKGYSQYRKEHESLYRTGDDLLPILQQAMNSEISKSTSVQILNDSVLVVGSMHTINRGVDYFIQFDTLGKMHVLDTIEITNEMIENSINGIQHFHSFMQSTKGVFFDGALYILKPCRGCLPWEKLSQPMNYAETTYFCLYKINVRTR